METARIPDTYWLPVAITVSRATGEVVDMKYEHVPAEAVHRVIRNLDRIGREILDWQAAQEAADKRGESQK